MHEQPYNERNGTARDFLGRLPGMVGEYDQRLTALLDEIASVRAEYAAWVLGNGREDEQHARRLAGRIFPLAMRLHGLTGDVSTQIRNFAYGGC